jgi:hypothetical protein
LRVTEEEYSELSEECASLVLKYYKNKRVQRVSKTLELALKYNNVEEGFMNAEF